MNSLLLLALHLLIPAVAWPATQVVCADSEKNAELTLSFNKSDVKSAPAKLILRSGGKAKEIQAKNISRYVRNANDFYVLFKVEAKSGVQEVELNTRFVKRNSGRKSANTATGYLTNKSQPEARLTVTCRF